MGAEQKSPAVVAGVRKFARMFPSNNGGNVNEAGTLGQAGEGKAGIIDADGKIRDLSAVVPDIVGAVLSPAGLAKLSKLKLEKLPLVKGKPRYGACVGHVPNFYAVA